MNYVTHLAVAESFNTQRDFNSFISGDIMKLPGGDWKGSVGFENRRESADFTPDSFYSGTYGQALCRGNRGVVHHQRDLRGNTGADLWTGAGYSGAAPLGAGRSRAARR